MLIVEHLEQLHELRAPVHWAMGFFDGVHRGHLRVIQAAVPPPDTLRGVLTFDRHPLELLRPAHAPALLTPDAQQKAELIAATGADVLLRLPFTAELAAMDPLDFLDALAKACPLAGISVGANWRFGRGGSGTPDLLLQESARRGFCVCIQPLEQEEHAPVSSSRIRAELAAGNLQEVQKLLGRPFGIAGEVLHGQKLARQLGFPTANVSISPRAALPPYGVYRVICHIDNKPLTGIGNLGLRPTIREQKKAPGLEVHFPGWQGDLYGRRLNVELLEHLRPERRFPSLEELKRQIEQDVAAALAHSG